MIYPRREKLMLQRSLGAALALAMAASPLLGLLHEAAVRHVACPEDGELIEAPLQAAHAHQASADDSLFPERPLAPETPGHDHCFVALNLRSHVSAALAQPMALAAPVATDQQLAVPELPQLRSIALYRLAPKASPPA